MTKRVAVYPGSFDPFHNGHLDIIERCRPLFDELIVAVLHNTEKKALFTPEERVEMISQVLAGYEGCRVATFSGLLVHFMDKVGARTTVRGLRAVSDFESEFQMAQMNRRLDPRVETVFLTPKEEYSYLSSRLVKEVYLLGGDLTGLVPEHVIERLQKRVEQSAPE
ncbi:MAG TPA: pantetheine-phosphate adenylyltransferase [Thermoanaerobaculia bacterium]|jgi:pantetheine-phosphate adenylyltransferase